MYAHRGFSPFVWFVTLKDDLDALFCLAFLSHMYLNLFTPLCFPSHSVCAGLRSDSLQDLQGAQYQVACTRLFLLQ